MENNTNHIDYNAPLRSVRRFHSAISAAGAVGVSRRRNRSGTGANADDKLDPAREDQAQAQSQPERETQSDLPTVQRPTSLPFYKSDVKSGPYREPGVVPFVWEQAAGCPKQPDAAQCSSSAGLPDEEPLAGRTQTDVSSIQPGKDSRPGKDGERSEDAPSSSSSTQPAAPKSTAREQPPQTSPELPKAEGQSNPVSSGKASWGGASFAGAAAAANGGDDRASDAFSDALDTLDTLSLADSCFMNCSVSGTTVFPDAADQTNGAFSGKGSGSGVGAGAGGSFSTDPQVRDFMMGRFLPAAKAMASTSPPAGSAAAARRNTPERSRPVRNGERRQPVPLPYQNRPHTMLRYPAVHRHHVVDERSDDDSDDSDEGVSQYSKHLPMKGCGFLPRFCFSLMNPVPGAKLKGRLPSPHRRIITSAAAARPVSPRLTRPMPSDQGGERTWEAVYNHKLGRPDQRPPLENGSKLTSGESNQLTYWSDSQSPDGSSPFRRSTGCSPSPFAHDRTQSPFRVEEGSVGTPPKQNSSRLGKDDSTGSGSRSSDKYLDFAPHSASWSGSGSPAVEKTLYVDSENTPETPISRLNSAENGRMDRKLLPEGEVVNGGQLDLPPPDSLDKAATAYDCKDATAGNELVKGEDPGNNDLSIVQALLPPPLPKSPSESWLWRTLPNVPTKKKGTQASTEPKWETIVKTGSHQIGQTRFMEVLAKPVNEE